MCRMLVRWQSCYRTMQTIMKTFPASGAGTRISTVFTPGFLGCHFSSTTSELLPPAHEQPYRHHPYLRCHGTAVVLRRCCSSANYWKKRRPRPKTLPWSYHVLSMHAGDSSRTTFSSLVLCWWRSKVRPSNGLPSCPFGLCRSHFTPVGETNNHLSSDSSLFSRISSVVAAGGKRADYCNSL